VLSILLHVCFFALGFIFFYGFIIIRLGALVALYEEAEKPNNAAEFVRRYMGATGPDTAEMETVKNELLVAREKYEELLRENEALKEKLQKYESGERGQ
jgi:hypothetical protein